MAETDRYFPSISTFHLSQDLLEQTLRILREEGKFTVESILFWGGEVSESDATVTHIFIPKGKGIFQHPLQVRVTEETMAAVCELVSPPSLVLLGQVHTHLMDAFHSSADDQNSLDTPGFLSLVVPYGGRDGIDTWKRWGFYECLGRGQFRGLSKEEIDRRFIIVPNGKAIVYDVQT